MNCFNGKAIYLLDESEAALSPFRQLTFLKIIHNLASGGNVQFIITVHSPILLGYPGASIFSFNEERITEVEYEIRNDRTLSNYEIFSAKRYFLVYTININKVQPYRGGHLEGSDRFYTLLHHHARFLCRIFKLDLYSFFNVSRFISPIAPYTILFLVISN
ncbi:hypothetical protein [Bacillus panaciterrae]|uniref:hypothetical protein n=1 Tax=Ectobacillus panaciterrae TaxID=363872 RepID=UPI0004160487